MYNKLICITNRSLCGRDFIGRIRDILDMDIPVILREKDLSETEYYKLLCKIGRRDIIAHSFTRAAKEFGCRKIHLPLSILEAADITSFDIVGSSTHSVQQALQAQALGASYITTGHIFATDCKKGLAPHGTELITQVTGSVSIPIYALGGISQKNILDCIKSGAAGAAVMSGFMKCANIWEYVDSYRHILG